MSEAGKTCADLAGATGLSKGVVRRRLTKLEQAGLVSRAGGRRRPGRWKRGPVIYPPAGAAEAEDSEPDVESQIPAAQLDALSAPVVTPPAPRQSEPQDEVLFALIALHNQCESGTVTAEEVAAEAGLHLRAAQRYLAKLAEAGKVVKVKSRGRGAGWKLPPTPQDVARAKVAALLAELGAEAA